MRNNECVKVQDGGYYVAGMRIGFGVAAYDMWNGRFAEAIFDGNPSIGLAAKVYRTIPFTLEDSRESEA